MTHEAHVLTKCHISSNCCSSYHGDDGSGGNSKTGIKQKFLCNVGLAETVTLFRIDNARFLLSSFASQKLEREVLKLLKNLQYSCLEKHGP